MKAIEKGRWTKLLLWFWKELSFLNILYLRQKNSSLPLSLWMWDSPIEWWAPWGQVHFFVCLFSFVSLNIWPWVWHTVRAEKSFYNVEKSTVQSSGWFPYKKHTISKICFLIYFSWMQDATNWFSSLTLWTGGFFNNITNCKCIFKDLKMFIFRKSLSHPRLSVLKHYLPR